jgi:NADH dehydrogenase
MVFVCATTHRKRWLVPIPFSAAYYMALLTEITSRISLGLLPHMLLTTRDQVRLLRRDNVVSTLAIAEGRTLDGLRLDVEAIQSIVPTYLYRFRKTGQFDHQPPV